MEIPYLVEARKDTGLFNSKIAIWLFLASEVMLFGGLFSAYVFLRIYADFPWPERTLPILPGLINTFILIASSVAVVMAWAALKLRKKAAFNLWMAFTVVCAVFFMAFKGIEYNAKFHHHAARLDDFTVVEGHVEKEGNDVVFEVEGFTFSAARWDKSYFENITSQLAEADNGAYQLTLLAPSWNEDGQLTPDEVVVRGPQQALDNLGAQLPGSGKAGFELLEYLTADGFVSYDAVKGAQAGSLNPEAFQFAVEPAQLEALREAAREAAGENSALREANLRAQWAKAKAQNPGKDDWQIEGVAIDEAALAGEIQVVTGAVTLYAVNAEGQYADLDGEAPQVSFEPYRPLVAGNKLKDDTQVLGRLSEESSSFEISVDALDFQHLAMRAEEADKDPFAVIEQSWILNEGDAHGDFRKIWNKHLAWLETHTAQLAEDGKEPTDKEKFRVEKQEILKYHNLGVAESEHQAEESHDGHGIGGEVAHAKTYTEADLELHWLEKAGVATNVPILGGMIEDRHHQFPHLSVPRQRIQHESVFSPAWNNYYAIYFTITGLHGLHVIGGALVLGYFWLVGGGRMYRENPEWLANRVEVGGLFWHFVDLVWIFLFPILYLM